MPVGAPVGNEVRCAAGKGVVDGDPVDVVPARKVKLEKYKLEGISQHRKLYGLWGTRSKVKMSIY